MSAPDGGPGGATIHGIEDGIGCMLDGHVDVGAEFFLGGQQVDEVFSPARGVGVEEANPFQIVDAGASPDEVGQPGPSVDVGPIGHGVLATRAISFALSATIQ